MRNRRLKWGDESKGGRREGLKEQGTDRREIETKGKEEGKWDGEGDGRRGETPAISHWGGERRAGSGRSQCWTTMNRGCAATSEACCAHQTSLID